MVDENLERIKIKYNVSTDDLQVINKEIKRKIKKNHPDTNHENFESISDFSSEEDRQEFLGYIEDLKFIERLQEGRNLIPYSIVREIVEKSNTTSLVSYREANKLMVKSTEYENAKKVLSDHTDENIKKLKYSNWFPKISLSGISAILTIIWLVPSSVQNHPILSKYVDVNAQWFFVIWIGALIFTGFYWVIIYQVEKCQTKILAKLNDEFFQRSCLTHFLGERKLFNNTGDPSDENLFLKSLFINYALYYIYSIASRIHFGFCSPREWVQIQFSSIDFNRLKDEVDLTLYGSITFEGFNKYNRNTFFSINKFYNPFYLYLNPFFKSYLISNLNESLDSQTMQNYVNAILTRGEIDGLIELANTDRLFDEIYRVKIKI